MTDHFYCFDESFTLSRMTSAFNNLHANIHSGQCALCMCALFDARIKVGGHMSFAMAVK